MQGVFIPDAQDDVVRSGLVRALTVSDQSVYYVLDGMEHPEADLLALKVQIGDALRALGWVTHIDAVIAGPPPAPSASDAGPKTLEGVGKIILVGSGKGGVGKSTVTANLARAFAARGMRVGVLDADVYGPSQPHIFGTSGRPVALEDTLIPIATQGVKLLSVGSMIGSGQALLWRGTALNDTLFRMIFGTRWAPLDVLLIDLPPGTGDVPLTILQHLKVTGAVVVSTPQDLSLPDVRRGINLFRRTDTPILGLIENMALHACTTCGSAERLFGPGLEDFARETGIAYLGALPLSHQVSDHNPGTGPVISLFDKIADALLA